MKIAIAGTRGIPNDYGGFEQCAEFLSVLFEESGHDVIVYNSHDHPYKQDTFNEVSIKHIYNPEKKIGAAGNFIYDYLCMRHAIRNEFDVILMLGYTTASVFYPLLDFRNSVLVTNMDGLEWKRDKWSSTVKKLALWFEKLGAKYSHHHIADNERIRDYLMNTYQIDSTCIAYGSNLVEQFNEESIKEYNVEKNSYSLIIARLEAENNIEMILKGYIDSELQEPILVVGKINTQYGRMLEEMYKNNDMVSFLGGIYDIGKLNDLRHFCKYYFHGHSVGGTNPSLLEAMASGAFIIAHGNEFNRWVTDKNAGYFLDSGEITSLISKGSHFINNKENFVKGNIERIHTRFHWKIIAEQYLNAFKGFLTTHGQ
jgi:glycosyltransferase involved in cell wall biosynthesis